MHEIERFLREHPPFDDAADVVLSGIAASIEIEYFPAGSLIFREGESPKEFAYVIRSGHAEIVSELRVLDVLGEGDLTGVQSLAADLPFGVDVRAQTGLLAYRVPAEHLQPLLTGRTGLRYVARMSQERRRQVAAGDYGDAVPSLLDLVRPAVVVEPSSTVRDTVELMRLADASCAVVKMPEGTLGIVTDRDLRNRVLAVSLPLDTAVGEIASQPAISVAASSSSDDASFVMLDKGIRHLPVLDDDVGVLGVVEDIDLLASQSRRPLRLRRAIAGARSPEQLSVTARAIIPTLFQSVKAGQAAEDCTRQLSTLLEATLSHAIELALDRCSPAPAPFAIAMTGSVARGEATFASDLDTLMVWDGVDDEATTAWMHQLGSNVLATLLNAGFAQDTHGVRVDSPLYARPLAMWRSSLDRWEANPTILEADVFLSSLFDAKPVYGAEVWEPMAQELRRMRRSPEVRAAMRRVAVGLTPPTGFARDFVIESSGEHRGTLDLKEGGVGACVALGRYFATMTPSMPTSTSERYSAAVQHDLVSKTDGDDLTAAFHVVQQLRMKSQLAQAEAGEALDDRLRPAELTRIDQRALREAFRVISRVQRVLPSVTS